MYGYPGRSSVQAAYFRGVECHSRCEIPSPTTGIGQAPCHRDGYWRFVETSPEGSHGFEGRYRKVTPQVRIVQTFEWDGMPGHVILEDTTFEDLGDGRTRIVVTSLFFTADERDGMLGSGMEEGMAESYAALDRLLATMQ